MALHRKCVGEIGSRRSQRTGQPVGNLGRNRRERRGQSASGTPEIGYRENDAGSDDADANLADPIDSEHEGVPVRAAGLTEFVVRDDRGRITGQRRRVRGKILQDCGAESANGSPQRQPHEKRGAVLRKARAQHDDRNGTDDRADHAKPAFAQRRAELRLTHDRG